MLKCKFGEKAKCFFPDLCLLAILFLLPLILFFSVSDYEMVQDDKLVYFNTSSNYYDFDLNNFSSAWQIPEKSMYIPVTFTAWTLTAKLFPNQDLAEIFHLLNLIIHILNGMLLYKILRSFVKLPFAAFIGALLFVVHPIQVESWAYISELRGLLSVFFGLILFLIHIQPIKRNFIYPVMWILFAFAMLSKPTIVVLPILMMVYDRIIKKKNFNSLVMYYIPYVVIAIVPVVILLRPADQDLYSIPHSSFWMRPLFWMDSINFYLYKILLPFRFAASYARTPSRLVGQWWIFLVWIVPFLITYFTMMLRKKSPIFFLTWIWFIVAIIPVSGIIPFVYQNWSNVADRYIYLSFVAVALLTAYLISKLNKKFIQYTFLGVFILLSIFSSKIQLPVWQNDFTLWSHCVKVTPDEPKAYFNLANEYEKKNDLNSAFNAFNKATIIDSLYQDAWIGKGTIKRKQNDFSKSIAFFNKAAEIDGGNARIFLNRALVYIKIKRYNRAINDLTRAIRINPNYVEAYNNRGNLLAQSGHLDDAERDFNRVIKLDPNHAEAYNNLGNIYAQQKNYSKAVVFFSHALTLNNLYVDALRNRALALFFMGELVKAKKDLDLIVSQGNKISEKLYKEIEKGLEKG